MLAILAPGQGAQKQGFLSGWLTRDGVRERLESWRDSAGIDLVAAGTEMSDTDITDTAIAQPLIVAASLATAELLPALPTDTIFAGHSVGEFAAAALAGSLSADAALRLVAARGAAMASASAAAPSGMVAILGGEPEAVVSAITAAGAWLANFNARGQLVAAGTNEAIARLTDAAPAGARLRPLAVAGAFHTELMAPAQEEIAAAATLVAPAPCAGGMLSNSDGTLVHDGPEILRRLVSQVTRPVRWDLCMQTMAAMGVTAAIELAPAGTLTALLRRDLPDVATVALRDPDDLEAAYALISEHTAELTCLPMPWQLVVAPAKGIASLTDPAGSVELAAGDVVLQVSTRTECIDVRTDSAGHLVEWLVADGDPVNEGQPLARIAADGHA
ncbi:MAG TPA: acyltransferase domain-containing protein [Mycobacteriales bacterium]|nr:acyltransferase domain-containing protein [Mycobacteriales bacterium]